MLPEPLRAALRNALGTDIERVSAEFGGSINQALLVETDNELYFLKWNPDAPSGFFEAEVDGLTRLREAGVISVPTVIAYADATPDCPGYLLQEWLERRPGNYAENFGRALAALHRLSSPTFGLDRDNIIGKLPQRNTPTLRWIDFYRDHRIGAQMDLARQQGYLPASRERLLNSALNRLEELLSGIEIKPSLLHGDLWSGNFMPIGDVVVVFDPSVYYGHREIEMAFTELFGGFPRGFYSAYNEAYPLDAGYAERRLLYHLYPLLCHLNMFGEGYGGQIDSICRHYAG